MDTSVASSQLAPDPINPMGDGISPIGDTGFVSYNQNSDPNYQKQTSDINAGQQKLQGDVGKKAAMEADQQPDQFTQQPPQTTMVPQIMKSMAPLMIFTALGGAFTKQSGYTMLGALNGLVQGTLKGDEEGRNRAWQQYQDAYQKWKAKVDESHRIYNEHKAALGDTVWGDQQAQEFALKQRGDYVAGQEKRAGQINKERELMLKAQAQHDRLKEAHDKVNLWHEADREVDAAQKKQEALVYVDTSINALGTAQEAFKRLKGKYQSKFGSIVPKSMNDFMIAMGDDPDAQTFKAAMDVLKKNVTMVNAAGSTGIRMTNYIDKQFVDAIPDLLSKSDTEIATLFAQDRQQVMDMKATINQEIKTKISMVNEMRQRMGADDVDMGQTSDDASNPYLNIN